MPAHAIDHATDRYRRRSLRLLVLCLLALVLPLQGVAVTVFAVLGPSHVHSAVPRPAPPPAHERRQPPMLAASPLALFAPSHAFAWPGQVHAHAAAQRHHHAPQDSSVHLTGEDAVLDSLDAGQILSPGVVLGSLLAWIPVAAVWPESGARKPRARCSPWSPVPGLVQRPDRPPDRA